MAQETDAGMPGLAEQGGVAAAVAGIVTLLLVVPLWAGLAHQALGFAVLAMGVVHVTRTEQGLRPESA